jgi:hypothetical protein
MLPIFVPVGFRYDRIHERVESNRGGGPVAVWPRDPAYGLVVVRDWRGLGTRLYKLTCATDIFGWYQRGGYERFRLWVGWSAVAFALLMILIGVVGLVNLV